MSKRLQIDDENHQSSLSKKRALHPSIAYTEENENLINDIFNLDIVKHDDGFEIENDDGKTNQHSNEVPLLPDSTDDIIRTSCERKIIKIEPSPFSQGETSHKALSGSWTLPTSTGISRPADDDYSVSEILTSFSQPSTSRSATATIDELEVPSADLTEFEVEMLTKIVFPWHPVPPSHRRRTSNVRCVIEQLKDHPFGSEKWTEKERQDIIKHGMPEIKTADIDLWMDTKGFKMPNNFLKKVPWLTGCIKLRLLMCWPCLLAGDCGVWSRGYLPNNQIMTDSCNHSVTKSHLRNVQTAVNLIKHYTTMAEQSQLSTTKSAGPTDIIDWLIARSFQGSHWTDEQRRTIIMNGKPVPMINDFKYAHFQKNRTYLRSFNTEHYSNIFWLTGSAHKKKLFCWPCLLFNNYGIWGKIGFNNLSNLYAAVSRHEINTHHLDACLMLKAREAKIRAEQPTVAKLSIKNNPDLLKNLIDSICYSITRKFSSARDDFFQLMQLISGTNPKVNPLLIGNQAEVNDYAHHLSVAITMYLRARLIHELAQTTFVSVILSEVARIDITTWVALIVRYVNASGTIKERLVTCIVISPDVSSDEIINKVCTETVNLQCSSKVVGFTYDGSFANHVNTVQFNREFKIICEHAFFFPHKDHSLMRMVEQALSRFAEVRDFFHLLSKINQFAIRRKSALLSLDKELVEKLSSETDLSLHWVPLFARNFKPIVRIFKTVAKRKKSWSNQDVLEARVIVSSLLTIQCRFKIVLLYEVMPALYKLSSNFRQKQKLHRWGIFSMQFYSDTMVIKSAGWSCILSRAITLNGETEVCVDETISNSFVVCFEQVLDTISQLVLDRTCDLDSFRYHELVHNNQFQPKMQKATIPPEQFHPIPKFWSCFDPKRLTEFMNFALWSSRRILGTTLLEKFDNIRYSRLIDTLPDLYKFLKLIFTVPMYRIDDVSAVDELKNYAKDRKHLDVQETFLWMEREYLARDKRDGRFYSEICDHFQKLINQ